MSYLFRTLRVPWFISISLGFIVFDSSEIQIYARTKKFIVLTNITNLKFDIILHLINCKSFINNTVLFNSNINIHKYVDYYYYYYKILLV